MKDQKQEQLYPIVISWPDAPEHASVTFELNEGEEIKRAYIPANTPVNVPKGIYDIWVKSEWNPKRKKSEALKETEKKAANSGDPSYCDFVMEK